MHVLNNNCKQEMNIIQQSDSWYSPGTGWKQHFSVNN